MSTVEGILIVTNEGAACALYQAALEQWRAMRNDPATDPVELADMQMIRDDCYQVILDIRKWKQRKVQEVGI